MREHEEKRLSEKGFVFLDGAGRPFLFRMWNGAPWLFYWHPDNHWVSLRRVSQTDIWRFPQNLSEKEQVIYHRLHEKWENQ